MAQPGSSHYFSPMEDIPSATFFVVAFDEEDRHLRHFLRKTREITGLSPEHLPLPSLRGIGHFSLAESTILPLLYSLVHAISAMGQALEELRLQLTDLGAHVANSLPDVTDHPTQLNQIQSSQRDMSHGVVHPPAQLAASAPTQLSRPRPTAAIVPPGPPTTGAPTQPLKATTESDAATVGGTSNLDEAAQEIQAAGQNKKGKRNSATSMLATKVAGAT